MPTSGRRPSLLQAHTTEGESHYQRHDDFLTRRYKRDTHSRFPHNRFHDQNQVSRSRKHLHLPNQLQYPSARSIVDTTESLKKNHSLRSEPQIHRRAQEESSDSDNAVTDTVTKVIKVIEIVDETGSVVATSTSTLGPFLNTTSQHVPLGTGSAKSSNGVSISPSSVISSPLFSSASQNTSTSAIATTTSSSLPLSSANSGSEASSDTTTSASVSSLLEFPSPSSDTTFVTEEPIASTSPLDETSNSLSRSISIGDAPSDVQSLSSTDDTSTSEAEIPVGTQASSTLSPATTATPDLSSASTLSSSTLDENDTASSFVASLMAISSLTTSSSSKFLASTSNPTFLPTSSESSEFTALSSSTSSIRTTTSFTTSTTPLLSSLSADRASTITILAGDNGASEGDSGSGSQPTDTVAIETTTPTSSNDEDGPTTQAIVGGIVGGIAGVVLLAVLALFLIRRSKRSRHILPPANGNSSENEPSSTRGIVSDGPSNIPTSMSTAPNSLSFVPAGLAPGRAASGSSGGSQKGFERVSGRKLPSVLTHGGDGYSEPTRESVFSGTSFYRDSQGFYGGPGGVPLAVGTPMRPESGIMIVRDGPAKTPVTEQNPFLDPGINPFSDPIPENNAQSHNLSAPWSIRDSVGRTLTSQDGSRISRGSGSRFTEEI